MFSSAEHGEERKTTLKMKPHRVQKPFQVAAGHSIKTITILQSIHMHQNNYTQHIAIFHVKKAIIIEIIIEKQQLYTTYSNNNRNSM